MYIPRFLHVVLVCDDDTVVDLSCSLPACVPCCLSCRVTFRKYRDKYREKVKSVSPSSSLMKQITVSATYYTYSGT